VHPAILPATLAFGTAAALAVVVGVRRTRTRFHWLLLALLASLLVWTLGVMLRFSVASQEGLEAALRLIFLGVFTAPALWLIVAGDYAQVRGLSERRGMLAALLAPSLLAYGALLTNSGHHLVIREVSFDALERGGLAWAGPFFWVYLPWAYGQVGVASVLHLRSARRLARNADRRRGMLLAVVATLPVLASCVYLLQLLPVRFDLTPSALVLSLLLLSTTIFRYRLLESLPLTRRDVIEHLPDGVVLADADGRILDLNPAAAELLGVAQAALLHRPLAELLDGFRLDAEGRAFRNALARLAESAAPLSAELLADDQRRIEITALPVRDARGESVGQYALLRDRTEERRFERIARQTQRLQTAGTLVAGIAHEVNNPLAFIRANLSQIERLGEIVEAHRDGPEAKLAGELADLGPIVAETLDGILRIERIVSDMRRLSAPRTDAFAPVDLNEVARDALRLANLHRECGLAIETRFEPAPAWVDGSAQRLVQAVLNLLMNARQALERTPGARIYLVTRIRDGQASIEISDNGPGIPLELHERIFDPFFTTKDPDQGTGLGLAIAFDIARDHGGLLEVTSRPGGGASFTLRLPSRRAAAA
jgi:PAS domain S-box-containing protein